MHKRYIRLKEVAPGTDRTFTPTEAQLETTDGSPKGQKFRCRADNNGFIMTGNQIDTKQTIVFMGDSFVESMFAQEDQRFVSRVERQLGIKCHNAGYSGSTSLQLLNSLMNKVFAAVGPYTTVVLFPPHSDRDNIYKDGRYWNNSERGASILPVSEPGHENIPEGLESFHQILRIIVAASKELKLRLILATTPYRIADFSHDAPLRRLYRRNGELYHLGLQRRIDFCNSTRNVAVATDTPLIDVEAVLGGNPDCFYDELHLNALGHAAVAEVLSGQLPKWPTAE